MKVLARPRDFYDIEINCYGGGTGNPHYVINISDESDDGLPALVERINSLIDRGFIFSKFELTGDDIGYKVFNMEMKLKEPIPQNDKYPPHINPKTGKNYNWPDDGNFEK